MTEEDLMNACLDRKGKYLWHYLLENNELCEKYSLKKLDQYIKENSNLSVYDFFTNALNGGLKEKFICRLGIGCLDILYEFLDIVALYTNENTASISGFLKWFHEFEHEIKRESFSNTDSVRLMTAHSSKGLQSPFVILADANFFKPSNEKILKSENEILLWNFSADMKPKIVKNLYEEYIHFHEDESKRLLYVALTRAEDFLYILGEQQGKKSHDCCWYNFIKNNLNQNKFEEKQRDNHNLLKFGNYEYVSLEKSTKENQNISEKIHFEMPQWFFEKVESPPIKDSEIYTKTEQTIYGECVHFLLSEMPKYKQYFDTSFDILSGNILNKYDISDDMKNAAKSEAYQILINPKFDFIFDSKSLSEISFINNGKEGRIDKIAFAKDYILIVDFKTGIPQKEISGGYLKQLDYYKSMIYQMIKGDSNFIKSHLESFTTTINIKTAILWTQSAELVEVNTRE